MNPSLPEKGREFYDQLSGYDPVRNNSVPRSG
jgi:hypothetical protein